MISTRMLVLAAGLAAGTLLPGAVSRMSADAASFPVQQISAEADGSALLALVQGRRFGGRGAMGPRVVGPRVMGPRVVGPRVGPRVVGPRVVGPVGVWRPRRAYTIGPGFRPVRPWWRPGTAVVAGAALGFIAAGAAVAWAGQPPGPGYCWYYTDPSHRAGFWDICP